jgi:hypothetical protein
VQLGISAAIIILALVAFILFPLMWRSKETPKDTINIEPDKEIETKQRQKLDGQFDFSVLMHILKLRGLNQVASARNIAVQMNQDTGMVLSCLNKLHNDQFVTFQSGGLPPTLDTDFFLSPKVLEIINIDDTESVGLKRQALYSAYGVFWDTELNMHCLSCMKPLKHSTFGSSIFFCSDPKCNSKHVLKDDLGNDITKQEAINRMKASGRQLHQADGK